MRLDYTPNPPNFTNEDDQAILKRVQARRGERGLIPLDLALLHAPKLADGWNALLGAVRTQSTLPANVREICMLRPALLNRAWFEWSSHLPLFKATPEYTPAKLEVLQNPDPHDRGALSDVEWAVLRYADAVTRHVQVPDDVFEALRRKAGFSDKEVVEITTTVATYNMVSRFLVALDVGELNQNPPDFVKNTPKS